MLIKIFNNKVCENFVYPRQRLLTQKLNKKIILLKKNYVLIKSKRFYYKNNLNFLGGTFKNSLKMTNYIEDIMKKIEDTEGIHIDLKVYDVLIDGRLIYNNYIRLQNEQSRLPFSKRLDPSEAKNFDEMMFFFCKTREGSPQFNNMCRLRKPGKVIELGEDPITNEKIYGILQKFDSSDANLSFEMSSLNEITYRRAINLTNHLEENLSISDDYYLGPMFIVRESELKWFIDYDKMINGTYDWLNKDIEFFDALNSFQTDNDYNDIADLYCNEFLGEPLLNDYDLRPNHLGNNNSILTYFIEFFSQFF